MTPGSSSGHRPQSGLGDSPSLFPPEPEGPQHSRLLHGLYFISPATQVPASCPNSPLPHLFQFGFWTTSQTCDPCDQGRAESINHRSGIPILVSVLSPIHCVTLATLPPPLWASVSPTLPRRVGLNDILGPPSSGPRTYDSAQEGLAQVFVGKWHKYYSDGDSLGR